MRTRDEINESNRLRMRAVRKAKKDGTYIYRSRGRPRLNNGTSREERIRWQKRERARIHYEIAKVKLEQKVALCVNDTLSLQLWPHKAPEIWKRNEGYV